MVDFVCYFCCYDSTAKRSRDKFESGTGKPIASPRSCEVGLFCTYRRCQGFACSSCLEKIVNNFSLSQQKSDRWCREVLKFLDTDVTPPSFIGHCCEWTAEYRQLKEARKIPIKFTKFDGYMYLPEFGLLIDSPFKCIDVHGMGKSGELPPAWHCVISHKAAEIYYEVNLQPDGKVARKHLIEDRVFDVVIDLPHAKQTTEKFKVRLRTFLQCNTFQESQKGLNSPSVNELQGCLVVNDGDQPADIDIDIITGRFDACSSKETLLLFRSYKKHDRKGESTSMQESEVKNLYDAIFKQFKKMPFDVGRKGGSSGLPVADNDFFEFIGLPTSSPRQSRGVKFVKSGSAWACAYIKVGEEDYGEAAYYCYGVPKRGGQFKASQELMTKFPFLYNFAETKVYAAFILNEINFLRSASVQPTAVNNEIRIYEKSVFIAPGMRWTSLSRKGRESQLRPRQAALVQYVMHNKHTLVTHPVGFHVDVFADGKESLENKVCFVLGGRQKCPMGRGGAGPNRFVIAILDWVNSSRNQEKRSFEASGFSNGERLTEKNRAEWHSQQPQLKDYAFIV